jgi:hypothetical protein
LHGVAGAVLLCLQSPAQLVAGKRSLHGITAVAINHAGIVGAECLCRIDDMPQQGLLGQPVQHLRQAGAHARTLAGGENDDAERQIGILSGIVNNTASVRQVRRQGAPFRGLWQAFRQR